MTHTHIITLHKNDLTPPFDIEDLELDLSIFIEAQGSDSGLAVDGEGTTYEISLFGKRREPILAEHCTYFVYGWLAKEY